MSAAPPRSPLSVQPRFGTEPTAREMEVLKLICDGLSTKEIAAALHITFKTAAAPRANLMQKAGTRKVVHLYRWALRLEYVSLGKDETPD